MALTNDQLLDLDASRHATYDEGKSRELLASGNGDAYGSQLVVAGWIEGGVLYTDAVGGWDEPR